MKRNNFKEIDPKLLKSSKVKKTNQWGYFKVNAVALSAVGISSVVLASVSSTMPLTINSNSSIKNNGNSNIGNSNSSNIDNEANSNSNSNVDNSGSLSNNTNNNSTDNNTSTDNNSNNNDKTPIVVPEPEDRNGTLAASVSTELSKISLDFKQVDANKYGLEENYLDFSNNNDFSNFSQDWSKFSTDLYLYVNSLWTSNSKNFDVKSVNVSNFSSSSSDNKIILNKTQISFKLGIEIYAFKDSNINILGHTIKLKFGKTYNFEISAMNQKVLGTINRSSSDFYLGWKINGVNLKIDSNLIVSNSEFIPTKNSYSSAFQYTFNNLTGQDNYLELYKKNQPIILNMDSSKVKEQIKEKYDKEFSDKLDLIDYGIDMLQYIKNNPTVTNLFKSISTPLCNILVKLNILPSFLSPIILEALNSSNSVLSILVNNKNKILSFIETDFPEYYELAKPILSAISTNMTEDQVKSFDSLLSYVGINSTIIEIINKNFFGLNGTQMSLTDFVFKNISPIISAVSESNPNNSTLSAISTIIKMFFDDQSNAQKNVLDLIVKDANTKKSFFNALGQLVNLTSVSNILDILVTNNNSLNSSNIKTVLETIYEFVAPIFSRRTNYENFWNGYDNLTFTYKYVTLPSINKTNGTINFSYQINFHINSIVKLNLKPFKNLLDAGTVWKLINSFQNLSSYAGVINKNWLYSAAISFIPDYISVGGSELSDTTITYSSNNSKLYFSPIRSSGNYYLGYKFQYNTRISYQDQTLITSITSQYNKSFNWRQLGPVLVWGDFYYSNFWRSIISNIITRDYVFTDVMNIQYSNDKVADTTTYNPNLYTSGFEITPTTNKVDVSSIYKSLSNQDQSKLYDMTSYGSKFNVKWSNSSSYYEILSGFTPKLPQNYQDDIFKSSFSIKQNQSSLDKTNLAYSYSTDVLFNFSLPVKIVVKYIVGSITVNVNVNLLMFDFKLFLPFKYYDTTTKKLVDSYSTMYSYFDATVNQSQSWFWQSSFYQ